MLDEARITEICRDFSFTGFRVGGEITEKKLRNAREHFPIPIMENVIALYDETVFGSNKEGLAVCTTGIYWKNDWTVKSAQAYLPWTDLARATVELDPQSPAVALGGGNRVKVLQEEVRHPMAALLIALQQAAAEQSPADERLGLDRLQWICQEFIDKLSFHVRPNISEKKQANIREGYGVLPSDPVVLVVDTTAFGSAKTGLAVTESGLYWRNAFNEEGHEHSPLLWAELAACPRPLNRDADSVEFGRGKWFYAGGKRPRDLVLELAVQLWDWARAYTRVTADPPATDASPSAEPRQEVRRTGPPPRRAAPTPPPPPPAAVPPPPPPAPAPRRWMLARDGQTFGPFDTGTIEAMLNAGQIDPASSHAWAEGMPAWLPFRQVPELALLAPAAAPPPPPPPFAPAPPPPPAAPAAAASATVPADGGRVDVNRAAEDDLLVLPGITAERARRIVQRRASVAFASAAELGAFLGLAPHEVQALAAEAAFGPAAPVQPPAPGAGRVVDF